MNKQMSRNFSVTVSVSVSVSVTMNFDQKLLSNSLLMFVSFLQDVFLMIRRQKTTIFTDAKENTSVVELKRMIEGKCAWCWWWCFVCVFLLLLTAFV